jgi:antitoxin component YwqK of YwqJK toxin-antitoxin module
LAYGQDLIINENYLHRKDNLLYCKNDLFSGTAFSLFETGQPKSKFNVHDGKLFGKYEDYYEDTNWIKSNYQDSNSINQFRKQILLAKNELNTIDSDILVLNREIQDYIAYNLGGHKKLEKLISKYNLGKLKNSKKDLLEKYYEKNSQLSKKQVVKKRAESEIKSLEDYIVLEMSKPHYKSKILNRYLTENNKKNGEYINYYFSGEICFSGNFKDDLKTGQWKYFYENGNLRSKGSFDNGLDADSLDFGASINGRIGEWIYYRENGTVFQKSNWIAGFKNGVLKQFYENGNLEKELVFDNNLINGHSKFYYETGKVKAEGSYYKSDGGNVSRKGVPKNGREGVWKVYFESGKLEEVHTWKNGKINGLTQLYYENGNLKAEYTILNEIYSGVYKEYYSDGKLKSVKNYSNGKLNGLIQLYYETGNLKSEYTVLNEIVHGTCKDYFSNGQLSLVRNFSNGILNGPCKKYFDNGKLEFEMSIKNNKPHGPFKLYYQTGNVHSSGSMDTLSLAENNFIGDLYEYDKNGKTINHFFYKKDGTEINKLIKENPQRKNTLKSLNLTCSWCNKKFTGTSWSYSWDSDLLGGSPYCQVSKDIFMGLFIFESFCSEKCAYESCKSKHR